MPHPAPAHKSFADRNSLYQEITGKIIADLEQGCVPWVQPWGNVAAPLGLPKNAATGRCHELGHWSGHASRLNRDLSGGFGSPAYAREELIAEMTSAFVCAALSIVPTVRHADYLGSWLDVLREDNRAIIRAASAASKAADYLLAFRGGDPAPGSGG
jgi:antirestriction protein ArdC